MKELPVIDNRKKMFIIIMIFILFGLVTIIYLINRINYDVQISMEIAEVDLPVLEDRLKSIKISNYKISKSNDAATLFLKKTSLDRNNLNDLDIEDILFSNHTYEVYLVGIEFNKEISKYIQSEYTYQIDFKSVLKDPIITGKDIEKVKNNVSLDDSNEYYPSTDIKYTEYGKSKNEYISKQNDEEYVLITLLDDQFWAYGWVYSFTDLNYACHSNISIIQIFQTIGKSYTNADIKNIALFSKYSFKEQIKLIEIEKM